MRLPKEILLEAKKKFVETSLKVYKSELQYPIEFTNSGLKEAINQPHKYKEEKNEAILELDSLIKQSIHRKSAKNEKLENSMIKMYHYFEITINNEPSFIVVRERIDNKCLFYTIVDKIKGEVGTKK